LPRGYALNRGLAVQRAAVTLLGRIRAERDVPVVYAKWEHVTKETD
jgi:hypothetical protein